MTANGLSVYDGARFHNYGTGEGLANPMVNDILEISPDSLLIATNTGVLNTWVRGTLKMVQTKNGFCPVINKFYRGKDHKIYVASDQGLYRFEKDVFIPLIPHDPAGQNEHSFDDIYEIGNYFLLKKIWANASSSNMLLVHKQTLQSRAFTVQGLVSGVLPLVKEQLILVIVNQQIICLDLPAAEQGIIKRKKLPPRFNILQHLKLLKISNDRFENIWTVTTSAVIRVKPDGEAQTFDKSNGLDVNNIRSILVDKENVLWVLTDGNGIMKLVNRNIVISSTNISSLYEDLNGKTWILDSSGRELSCTDKKIHKKWILDKTIKFGSLGMRKKSLVLFDPWSVYEADPENEKGTLLIVKKIYTADQQSLNYLRAEIDDDDNIYIPGKFLTVISSGNQVIQTSLPGYVDQISFDALHQLWALTRTGELLCYKINGQNASQPLTLVFTDKLSIPEPRSMVIDKTGKLWIGTRNSGLYCLEYKRNQLISEKHWTTENGLTDNFIYHLVCDKNNVIWAGTQSGLDKIRFPGSVIESISRNNNIYRVIYKVVTGMDDKVWALSIGSILHVTNEDVVATNYQPQLQITRIMSGEKNLGIVADHIRLPSKTHELTIDVAAPTFIDEKSVQFSYLLDGSDYGHWSTPSSEGSFRFINLKPANYTLRLRAIFPVGHYAPQELVYHFTILPPWWQTWWFRTIVLIGVLTGIRFLVKAYYQKKLQKQKILFEKQQAIQQERTRIAMEMHDDLGSGLTQIRYLADGLFNNPPSLIKEKAYKIENSAKQLVDNMNDIIWTIKSDNNHLVDILGYIRKQAADMLENVGMDYKFDFPVNGTEIILANEQKRNLLLISKEAVHNIIKHSQASMVTITAMQDNKNLHLIFSDNGRGIADKNSVHFGNGLKNMKQRAGQINGNIEIIEEKGTSVHLTINLA